MLCLLGKVESFEACCERAPLSVQTARRVTLPYNLIYCMYWSTVFLLLSVKCTLCLFVFPNPPNSDMGYRIFNVRTWSFLCVRMYTHWELGMHTDSDSLQHFWLEKALTICFCSPDGVRTSGHRILSPTFYQLSHQSPVMGTHKHYYALRLYRTDSRLGVGRGKSANTYAIACIQLSTAIKVSSIYWLTGRWFGGWLRKNVALSLWALCQRNWVRGKSVHTWLSRGQWNARPKLHPSYNDDRFKEKQTRESSTVQKTTDNIIVTRSDKRLTTSQFGFSEFLIPTECATRQESFSLT